MCIKLSDKVIEETVFKIIKLGIFGNKWQPTPRRQPLYYAILDLKLSTQTSELTLRQNQENRISQTINNRQYSHLLKQLLSTQLSTISHVYLF